MIRRDAYLLLREFEKKHYIPQKSFEYFNEIYSNEDMALLKNLVWGTIRNLVKIDWYLKKLIKNYKSITPASKWMLRLGAYQLLSDFKPYVAVNETVKIAKNRKVRGFINATLKTLLSKMNDFEEPVWVKFSTPKWLYDYLNDHFPKNYTLSFMEKSYSVNPLTLRINSLKTSIDDLIKNLNDYNTIKTQHSPFGIIVENPKSPIEITELYKNGYFYIQHESSQIIPLILDPIPGEDVLDMCAAPGGKTTEIAQIMENKGKIIALDIDIDRLELIEKNAKRMGIDIIKTKLFSGVDYNEGKYDKILIDAPCSSLGTISIHPEVMHRVSKKDFSNYADIQKQLLENAINNLIKLNGEIVYSTCTISREENTENMKYISSKYTNIQFEKIDLEKYGIKYYYDGFGYYFYPDNSLIPFYVAKLRLL
ncbi:16S rRNA (cytosine967-C5)-methyltransferase [Marinitoga hydrogenitolerans DSM 16785]|uniref:16S rRNA (Cytosine967-C5)-methyltransferase n=1 Tax=Marinitoga hydrogenitolerans (strain DSM 16785 / JCM 12826 / AT1271) TaxID=1122195 RepID=A0A1M4V2B1_MARH1|nr:transcription antitermination factor NusB [Marinitoga hydrogenitolerans]SHE63069.1 16S rRNA (cytosine967-C5)-methyltransferase [Marinitoga hydrogenitolerans DSM 16785]